MMLWTPVKGCGISWMGPPLEGFGKTMGVVFGFGVGVEVKEGVVVKVAVGWNSVTCAPLTGIPAKFTVWPLVPVAPEMLN